MLKQESTLRPLPRFFIPAAGAIVILVSWLIFAVASPTRQPWVTQRPPDVYGWLTKGWASGHLHLSIEPPAEMLKLENPFDPRQNRPFRIVDVSYNHGHYYLYFGCAPVATLMLPWYLLTHTFITESFAVALYLTATFLVGSWLLVRVWRQWFAPAPALVPLVGMLVLGLGNLQFLQAVRPSMYEVARTSGYLGSMVVLAASYLSLFGRRFKKTWLLIASLGVGYTVGSRPTFAPTLLLLGAPLCFGIQSCLGLDKKQRTRQIVKWLSVGLIPLGVIFILLALYNWMRFGSVFEFGTHYQLNDEAQLERDLTGLSYIVPNLKEWAFAVPPRMRFFPFIQQTWHAVGFVLLMPIMWFAVSAPWISQQGNRAWKSWFGSLMVACLCTMGIVCSYFVTSSSYEIDFLVYGTFIACVGWLWISSGRRLGAWSTALGSVLGCVTIAVCLFYSIGQSPKPRDFLTVGRFMNVLPSWWENRTGERRGPVVLTLKFPINATGKTEPLLSGGESGEELVYVRYPASNRIVFGFHHRGVGGPESLEFSVSPGTTHTVVIYLGSFAAPRDHPIFNAWSSVEVTRAQTVLSLVFDGKEVFPGSAFFSRNETGMLIGKNLGMPGIAEAHFSGEIIKSTQLAFSDRSLPVAPVLGSWIDLHVVFIPHPGVTEPLLCTGENGKGDILKVYYPDAQHATLVVDHWGAGNYEGRTISLPPTGDCLLHLHWPALDGIASGKLVVEVGSETVFSQEQLCHPATSATLFFGVRALEFGGVNPSFTGHILSIASSSQTHSVRETH